MFKREFIVFLIQVIKSGNGCEFGRLKGTECEFLLKTQNKKNLTQIILFSEF